MKNEQDSEPPAIPPLPPATSSAAVEPGPNQYCCSWCEQIYDLKRDEDWNEEKAHAERERDFPGVPKEQCVVVCDDCYQKCRPDTLLNIFDRERKMLAKLAADTPQFFNPLDVMEAKKIRDLILKQLNAEMRGGSEPSSPSTG